MATKKDFYVGQTVYVVPMDFRGDSDKMIETAIKIIGRKYVTLDVGGIERLFNMSTMTQRVSWGYGAKLYLKKQDYFDKVEFSLKKYFVERYFVSLRCDMEKSELSLDELRTIHSIVKKYVKEG